MTAHRTITKLIATLLPSLLCLGLSHSASAAQANALELTQKTAENQVKNLLRPLLDQYCAEDCKLMGVKVTVDVASQEEVAPGFDDLEIKKGTDLAPSSARVKILIDDRLGPVSRSKLLDLLQQYLDTLDYPVKIDTQITHFPMPHGSEEKISAMRSKIEKTFLSNTNDLIAQFCPRSCILTDFTLRTEVVNAEEAQYGSNGEFVQDGDTAIKIKKLDATILMDQVLSAEEQANILEMIRLKNDGFKNLNISGKSIKFPRAMITGNVDDLGAYSETSGVGGRSSLRSQHETAERNLASTSKNSSESSSRQASESNNINKSNSSNAEKNTKEERFNRYEKIERVESGDAVQAELQKFKVVGLIFACSAIALLLFIAFATFRSPSGHPTNSVQRIIHDLTSDPTSVNAATGRSADPGSAKDNNSFQYSRRYEIERIFEELMGIYAQQPKVAKQVFTRILTEEGVETTAQCISLFGESIVIEMLRDPSLQTDVAELLEFYAKNPVEMNDEDKFTLLKKLQNRTVAGKLAVLGNRSTTLFDFLAEMDGLQILELIRTESLTVKSIILTQCDPQKRANIYAQMEPDLRMQLLTELSRIDYLPKDYIYNVATALKRKKHDNPKLNTEALPGSDVLVSLLERTGLNMQKSVVTSLEGINPDSARTVKSKLVSIDTLRFLRDGQLLEVILSLRHEELLQFLKGSTESIKRAIYSKSPNELVSELEEELAQIPNVGRESYQGVERKILNRMKIMSNEGQINLIETNERMFSESPASNSSSYLQGNPVEGDPRLESAEHSAMNSPIPEREAG